MSQKNIEAKIEDLVRPIIENLSYELYDVEYVKEGKDYYLRITIDCDKGISIEDCEKVNDAIDEPLDKADFIKDSYYLEVSSPGIERNLRKPEHFEKQIGNTICVKVFKAIDKQKEWIGVLKSYESDFLVLEVENELKKIEHNNIAIAKVFAELF